MTAAISPGFVATASPGGVDAKALWFLTRSSGVIALLLLSAVVVLGILGPVRAASRRWPRFAVATLHRDVALLSIVFVAIHVPSTVLDGFAPIGWLAAVVPFQSVYRTVWLGLGAVAFDLVLALVLTSLIRARLGYRRWRLIHWLAYASWPVAALHGLGTGSDATQHWMLGVTGASACVILTAVLVRLHRTQSKQNHRAWFALSLVVPLALVLFAVVGPLAPDWARRAGTPTRLLGAAARATPAAVLSTSATGSARPFSARLVGRARSTRVDGGALVDLFLTLEGGPANGDLLRIRLADRPTHGGGAALVGSQVDLLLTKRTTVLTGALTWLRGTRLKAQLLTSTGARLDLDAELRVDRSTGLVTGRLSAVRGAA